MDERTVVLLRETEPTKVKLMGSPCLSPVSLEHTAPSGVKEGVNQGGNVESGNPPALLKIF
jgi:hypothetical protein